MAMTMKQAHLHKADSSLKVMGTTQSWSIQIKNNSSLQSCECYKFINSLAYTTFVLRCATMKPFNIKAIKTYVSYITTFVILLFYI